MSRRAQTRPFVVLAAVAEPLAAFRRVAPCGTRGVSDDTRDRGPKIANRRKAIAGHDCRLTLKIVAGCCLCLTLAGCASASGLFSLRESAPNAYDVATEPPLAMPPSFNRLPKPTPGAPPTQRTDSAQAAEALLDPQSALDSQDPSMTPGQKALLQAAGPVPHNLQARLNRVSGPSVIVNAAAEWRRIQEDAALGKPVTDGETPVIRTGGQGFLGRLASWF